MASIPNVFAGVNPAADVTAGGNSTSSASSAPKEDALANKGAFLQLLIAQIKHQDPLNPTDSVQFLSQLAQFSELEQMIGIRDEIKALRGDIAAPAEVNQAAK
jgi:flagellar basal-body rod modification protein FlgD